MKKMEKMMKERNVANILCELWFIAVELCSLFLCRLYCVYLAFTYFSYFWSLPIV